MTKSNGRHTAPHTARLLQPIPLGPAPIDIPIRFSASRRSSCHPVRLPRSALRCSARTTLLRSPTRLFAAPSCPDRLFISLRSRAFLPPSTSLFPPRRAIATHATATTRHKAHLLDSAPPVPTDLPVPSRPRPERRPLSSRNQSPQPASTSHATSTPSASRRAVATTRPKPSRPASNDHPRSESRNSP